MAEYMDLPLPLLLLLPLFINFSPIRRRCLCAHAVTEMAAALLANNMASSISIPSAKATTSAPLNTSPQQ